MADYLDLSRIRALANQLDLRPSKGRGQNFLFDANTIRRIVGLSGVRDTDIVLEIGPGLGSLTVGLLHTGAQVLAVEIEPALAQLLPITMKDLAPDTVSNLTVIEQDALWMPVTDPEPTVLVSNLPYSISVPLIMHLFAAFPSITHGLFMVQLEVANRLVAPPGTKVYGIPSAKLAWYASSLRVGVVPPTVFWPAPKVDSGLVAFQRRQPPEGVDRVKTFQLIDRAFSQRRKMLRSVLSGHYGSALHDAFKQAGVSPEARAETLSIDDFARLASYLT